MHTRSPARILTALVATVAVIAAGTPAAAQDPAAAQRFAADSGDNCRYGVTQGQLEWTRIHPPELPSVAVSGAVIDRPVPIEPTGCRDDSYFTIASFSAFTGNVLVDREVQRTNNGVVSFSFRLAPELSPTPIGQIERVVIQVCRQPLVWVGPLPPQYCGRSQTYYPTNQATG